ncbi:glycine cleavage system protein GcvH [Candidatus Nitrosacidococcus tergens]|uniref:Glycine cleavage system H protein n=1 Tax=Candidatus Nitrosacidococcus tergens TaxID=553981 RepID=A0A7G1Q9Y9_9GAMM|nr:glycine cleavage system protein GcvH [Candidatus Nitrosacidococcus tergens]CAB1276326.1 glycine cleavage complex lipoylprotein [Candidatus Nitrosacidococcus tergens]
MSNVPSELKYSKTHEWVKKEGGDQITIGISNHAQQLLGDIVYVELPAVGTNIQSGSECMVVESVKAASDIYAPIDGEVIEINTLLADRPELINQDPYGNGWLFRLQINNMEGFEQLLDSEAYIQFVADENH